MIQHPSRHALQQAQAIIYIPHALDLKKRDNEELAEPWS